MAEATIRPYGPGSAALPPRLDLGGERGARAAEPHAGRLLTATEVAGDYPPREEQGLPEAEITLAELLRERGYRTLQLGKWHLGESPGFQPEAQGFDESLAFYVGGSMYLPRTIRAS